MTPGFQIAEPVIVICSGICRPLAQVREPCQAATTLTGPGKLISLRLMRCVLGEEKDRNQANRPRGEMKGRAFPEAIHESFHIEINSVLFPIVKSVA